MEKITSIKARLVPLGHEQTVHVTIETEHKFTGDAEIPAGISVGSDEAKLIDPTKALHNIEKVIAPALLGKDALEQREIDQVLMDLDGTLDRSKLGVNAMLPVSMATCRAGAAALERNLYEHIAHLASLEPKIPQSVIVVIEGGKHAKHSSLSIQEFSVIVDNPGDGLKVREKLIAKLKKNHSEYTDAGQGGVEISGRSNEHALELLKDAAGDSRLALDIAATHGSISADEVEKLIKKFPLDIIEDPIEESKLDDWVEFTKKHNDKIVAADDLTVGDPARIKDAVKNMTANCLVVKLNQTGTVSELFDIINLIKVGSWKHVVSHRGKETNDSFITDLAVGTGADYLKAGNPFHAQRKSKYDRLLEIKKHLANNENFSK